MHERDVEHISVSEIREYFSCPLRWWYRYRLGLWTDKTAAFFALGTSVHAGLAGWYAPLHGGKLTGDIGLAYRQYDKTFAEESAKVDWAAEKEADPIGQGQMGKTMLQAAIYAGDDWNGKHIEHTMFADITHSRLGTLPIKLKAQVDLLLDTNDVVEHKTAARKWEEGREHGDIQATAYTMAVRQNYEHDPSVTFNIISKNAKGPLVDRRVTTRNQDDIDRLYTQARVVLTAMEQGIVYPNPTAFAHATCEYKEACNRWESHPQQLPQTEEGLKKLLPVVRISENLRGRLK